MTTVLRCYQNPICHYVEVKQRTCWDTRVKYILAQTQPLKKRLELTVLHMYVKRHVSINLTRDISSSFELCESFHYSRDYRQVWWSADVVKETRK